MEDLDAYWLAKGTEQLARARAGDPEITYDIRELPDTWLAAELLTFDDGTEWELGAGHIIGMVQPLAVKPAGDVVALLTAAEGTTGDARIAALEAAWRACFDPALAAAIEALDAQRAAPAMPVAKTKKATEALWAEAARAAVPRSLFAGAWPKTWRDAQRRMRAMYQRPRSPLFAAAAVEFLQRDPLPYTSIASSTFWQAFGWFIAEQGDARQLDALAAFETAQGYGTMRVASDALRAFRPPPLPAPARALIDGLVVPAKPARPAELSLANPEERAVAADQLQLAGDPRGELVAVQDAIAIAPTPELLKRQAKLVKKHARTWVPHIVYRDTCVFRGGVMVAGHLLARSDVELAGFAGSRALATFDTLIIDDAFAMGEITGETIAKVAASLPALRTLRTTSAGARALAHGSLERLVLTDLRDLQQFPRIEIRRVDVATLGVERARQPWIGRLEALGTQDAKAWAALRTLNLPCLVGFTDALAHLHGHAPTVATPWELWADRKGTVTAKPQVGSTADSLAATLAQVSWDGVARVRVPANFADVARARVDVEVAEAPAFDPATLGISVDLLSVAKSVLQTRD